LLREVH